MFLFAIERIDLRLICRQKGHRKRRSLCSQNIYLRFARFYRKFHFLSPFGEGIMSLRSSFGMPIGKNLSL